MTCKYYLFFMFLLVCDNIDGNSKSFGKFKLQLVSLEKCKGPKRIDCCKMDWEIVKGNILNVTMNATEDIAPLRAKILVGTNGNNLIRLQTNKVCDHMFLKPFIESLFNITKNCIIFKGSYKYIIDIEKIVDKYYGGEFFYGNISVYAILNNNRCNFSCSMMNLNLTPKL